MRANLSKLIINSIGRGTRPMAGNVRAQSTSSQVPVQVRQAGLMETALTQSSLPSGQQFCYPDLLQLLHRPHHPFWGSEIGSRLTTHIFLL